MSCLEHLVRDRVAEGQRMLGKGLTDWLTGGTMRDYLPQTWVLVTEQETLAIHADAEGKITVGTGPAMIRDGAVMMRHDLLAESIRTGTNPSPREYQVSFYTDKGKAAFEHLSHFFGL